MMGKHSGGSNKQSESSCEPLTTLNSVSESRAASTVKGKQLKEECDVTELKVYTENQTPEKDGGKPLQSARIINLLDCRNEESEMTS